jgi:hypothetical protein
VVRQPANGPSTRVNGFLAVESYAAGGLAGAWGAVSFNYLDSELERSGLVPAEILPHYEIVASRIGISAAQDDLSVVRGQLSAVQPALKIDANAASVFRKYERHRIRFNRAGVYMGRPMLAVLSIGSGERSANPYHNMDFWSNAGDSVYRPQLTLRTLCRRQNFGYQPGWLVRTFGETANGEVAVQADSVIDGTRKEFRARRLILAAGALGTTRIVLTSLDRPNVRVPMLCNTHTYVPCINVSRIGRLSQERRHSLAQLSMVYDPTRDKAHLVQAQMYSYGSLLLFRLLERWPLGRREGLRVARDLAPSLVIWVIQHEDSPRPGASCSLRRNGDEHWLEIVSEPDAALERQQRGYERTMMRWMGRSGCWPLKVIRPGHGSSIHYGGQFPMTSEDRPLTTDPSGRLRETSHVFVADGSALAYLPAKGLTFTLMANADRVGHRVRQSLELG